MLKEQPTKRMGVPGMIVAIVVMVLALPFAAGVFGICSFPSPDPTLIVESQFSILESALTIYESKCRRVPTTGQGLQALIDKPTIEPIPRNWARMLDKVPADPWGIEYRYQEISGGTNLYQLVSSGADRLFDTEDDLSFNHAR